MCDGQLQQHRRGAAAQIAPAARARAVHRDRDRRRRRRRLPAAAHQRAHAHAAELATSTSTGPSRASRLIWLQPALLGAGLAAVGVSSPRTVRL